MYKDSCCAQATMQSVNAFSRETLAASPSCRAGRNKVYQKKRERKLLDIFSFLFFFSCAPFSRGRTRTTPEQGMPSRMFWWLCSDARVGHGPFFETTAVKPRDDNY